jgi:hypothetical protein
LVVPDLAHLALLAAAVVVDHHPLADRRLGLGDGRAARHDLAARLVAADVRRALLADTPRRAVAVQVAAAHTGRLHLDDDLARPRIRVCKVHELDLAVTREVDTLHRIVLPDGSR